MCGCLSCDPNRGPGLQPRHVPCLGIKLATLWFAAHAQSTEPHQPGLQEFLKHAKPDYLIRGTDLFSLRLSNKIMTTANTIAILCE